MSSDRHARIILLVGDEGLVSSCVAETLNTIDFAIPGPAPSVAEGAAPAAPEQPRLAVVDIRLAGTIDEVGIATRWCEHLGLSAVPLTVPGDPATGERGKIGRPAGLPQKSSTPDRLPASLAPRKPGVRNHNRPPHLEAIEAEIHGCAQAWIERHGADAALRAIERINAAIDAGNSTERDRWAQVFCAIQQIGCASRPVAVD